MPSVEYWHGEDSFTKTSLTFGAENSYSHNLSSLSARQLICIQFRRLSNQNFKVISKIVSDSNSAIQNSSLKLS